MAHASILQGVLNRFFPSSGTLQSADIRPVPVDLLVTGSVPAGSGLSSRYALKPAFPDRGLIGNRSPAPQWSLLRL